VEFSLRALRLHVIRSEISDAPYRRAFERFPIGGLHATVVATPS
jgi:hypothetical protein